MDTDTTPLEGNWIRVERLKKGLTLTEVATYAGVTPAYLAQVETNRARPSVQVLYWVAERLGYDDVTLALWPFVGKVKEAKPVQGVRQEEALFEL